MDYLSDVIKILQMIHSDSWRKSSRGIRSHY